MRIGDSIGRTSGRRRTDVESTEVGADHHAPLLAYNPADERRQPKKQKKHVDSRFSSRIRRPATSSGSGGYPVTPARVRGNVGRGERRQRPCGTPRAARRSDGAEQPEVVFEDKTAEVGLEPANAAACWADLNGNGFVDLYVGGYETWKGRITWPSPLLVNKKGKALHFGLGEHQGPVSLNVFWPNKGQRTLDNVQTNRLTTIRFSASP
jgi:hypothetical protein